MATLPVPTLAASAAVPAFTPITLMGSPSTSVSRPPATEPLRITPLAASTFSVAPWFTAPVSACATGAGLVTVKLKPCVIAALWLSVAVTTTAYTPPVPPWLALWFSVPVMAPVLVSMLRPAGRLDAEYVKTLLESLSVKASTVAMLTTVESACVSGLKVPTAVGASFVPVMVTVTLWSA